MSILEKLAALEHEQWMVWSKSVAATETISGDRLERWEKLWIPYEELSEEMKERDRRWAKMAMKIIGDGLGALQ